MKLLWLLKSELNSNRKSTVIFILQLVFAIVCYNICLSLTGKYLSSLSYFKKHDTSNAIKVIYQGNALEQADSLIKSQEVEGDSMQLMAAHKSGISMAIWLKTYAT